MASLPVILDLATLPSATELSRPVAEALALAASVVLDRASPGRTTDAASITGGSSERPAELRRVVVDDAARSTYADYQEATEEVARPWASS